MTRGNRPSHLGHGEPAPGLPFRTWTGFAGRKLSARKPADSLKVAKACGNH